MNDYATNLSLLSAKSVDKHFDAYRDIDWDAPDMKVDAADPRWELDADDDPLGSTRWYRQLPASVRSRLGLHVVVHHMKVGMQFENLLTRGLLGFAGTLPSDAPELRYAYHEAIEESQHSLMFMELVRRSGLPIRGLHGFDWRVAQRIPRLARTFPEKFFLHVLAGEVPIDHAQRRMLRKADAMPPILRRIVRIHVLEEARHLSFARSFFERNAPKLGGLRRLQLQVTAPVILSTSRAEMMNLPPEIIAEYRIPKQVISAIQTGPAHRARVQESLEPVRRLCLKTGILTPTLVPWWRLMGLWPDDVPALPAAA